MTTRQGGSSSRFMDNFLLKMCLRGANRETDMELFALIQFKIRFEKN